MLKNILLIVQIVFSVLLVVLILIQARGKGFGRSSSFSSSNSFSRRGLEKLTFKLTFIVAGVFLLVSILHLYV